MAEVQDVQNHIKSLMIRLNELRPLNYEEATEFMQAIRDARNLDRGVQFEQLRQELIKIRGSGVVSTDWFDRQYALHYRK